MYIYKSIITAMVISSSLMFTYTVSAQEALVRSAKSAAPEVLTKNATIRLMGGEILVEGNNGWTCYPGTKSMGPMCNREPWNQLIAALMNKQKPEIKEFSVSYMLAGEGEAAGVSNIDPYATAPTKDNDWIKEGPHLMIIVPDASLLEGVSTNPNDPVYVMWKGTPYAHLMIKL